MVIALPILLLLGALLAVSALCSATEAAMLSINKVRLRHLIEQGHREARRVFHVLTHLDRAIGTLLIANSLISVAISTISAWIAISTFGKPEEGLAVATLLVTAVLLLVGEVTPKMFAATHPEVVAFAVVRPLQVLMVVLYPIATAFTWAGRTLLRLLRVPVKRRSPLVTEEEIKVMIQMGREAGVLAEEELRLLHRIFEFSDSVVGEVMVPRAQIVGIDLDAKADEVLDILIEQGYARIPVYRGTIDQIMGVIYARDVLAMVRHGGLLVLGDLVRPVKFVSESKRLAELLSEFQRDKIQIAIARNAQGATTGLITLEDLMEEIVGEIKEEAPKW